LLICLTKAALRTPQRRKKSEQSHIFFVSCDTTIDSAFNQQKQISMKTPKGSILLVAAILSLATSFMLTTSCKNSGNTESSTDTVATNTDTVAANTTTTVKADTAVAPMPKKTGTGMVVEPIAAPTEKIVEDKDHVYNHAEVPPAFAGGQSALDDYVKDNIKYPGRALDHGIEGKVMVHFVVDEHGNVTNVTTLGDPIGYGLEEEAIRVVSDSPKWTPGKVKGKDVKTYVLLPIAFTLR